MSALVSNDLTPLLNLPSPTITSLCLAAVTYITTSFSPATATTSSKELIATNNLTQSQATITACLLAVAKIYTESSKRNHDEAFFRRGISCYELPAECVNAVTKVYLENRQLIFETVPTKSSSIRQYENLSYRTSVEITRRSIASINNLSYAVRVDTDDDSVIGFQVIGASSLLRYKRSCCNTSERTRRTMLWAPHRC